MRRGVTWTKTTLTADEILQCRCRAGESWPADCSKAVVQRLQSSGRRTVLVRGTQHVSMSADHSRRERRANSHRQDASWSAL